MGFSVRRRPHFHVPPPINPAAAGALLALFIHSNRLEEKIASFPARRRPNSIMPAMMRWDIYELRAALVAAARPPVAAATLRHHWVSIKFIPENLKLNKVAAIIDRSQFD